jgi:hypothetical protein
MTTPLPGTIEMEDRDGDLLYVVWDEAIQAWIVNTYTYITLCDQYGIDHRLINGNRT